VRIVIDHVSGSRRGQRQEFEGDVRVRFGRHPECEVSFDPQRDIDASSRHAELRHTEERWMLADLGSSNGTFVDGARITEATIEAATVHHLEFGPGGPLLRIFIGDDAAIAALSPPVLLGKSRAKLWMTIGLLAVIAASVILALS
jgi:pSer/pThr/pTyr-binding forkhead associated (FHA) protein